jgi:hypothetical protein
MNWRNFSWKTKLALVMMLVAIIPTVAGVTIGMVVFGEAAPPFVYAFPVVWLILFFIGLVKLKAGLIGGIVWAVINIFAPVIVLMQGIKSSLAVYLGMAVCPFSILTAIISAVIIYLCLRAYKELSVAAA